MDLNDAERYAVAALFTLALHSTHVESGVDKNGNSLSESDIAWGCPSEELFDEQLLSQVPLKLPSELLEVFWGFDCMAPAGLAPRLYAWLKVPRKAWPGLLRMPDLAGCAGSAEAVEAFVTLVRRYSAFLDPELDFTTGQASRLQQHFSMPAAVAEGEQEDQCNQQEHQQDSDTTPAAGTPADSSTSGSRGPAAVDSGKGSSQGAAGMPAAEAVAAAAASLTAAAIAAEADTAEPLQPPATFPLTSPQQAAAAGSPVQASSSPQLTAPAGTAAALALEAEQEGGLAPARQSTAAVASLSFDALHAEVDLLPKEADEGTVVPAATFTPADHYKHTTSHKAVLALYELIGGCLASNTEQDMEPLFAMAAQEAESAAFAAAAAKGNKKALQQLMQQQQQSAASSAAQSQLQQQAQAADAASSTDARPAAAWFPASDGGAGSSAAAGSAPGKPQQQQQEAKQQDSKQQQELKQLQQALQVQGLAALQWYDARARVAVKRVAHWLRVPWPQVRAFEQMWSAQALTLDAASAQPKYDSSSRAMQYLKVGAAAVGGGALLAVTGGLAAPAIAAGLGAAVTLAHGGAAVAAAVTGFAGSTAGTAAVTGLFGAWGASASGGAAGRLYGEVTEFGFWDLSQSIYVDGKGPERPKEEAGEAGDAKAAAAAAVDEGSATTEKQQQQEGKQQQETPAASASAGAAASSSQLQQAQPPGPAATPSFLHRLFSPAPQAKAAVAPAPAAPAATAAAPPSPQPTAAATAAAAGAQSPKLGATPASSKGSSPVKQTTGQLLSPINKQQQQEGLSCRSPGLHLFGWGSKSADEDDDPPPRVRSKAIHLRNSAFNTDSDEDAEQFYDEYLGPHGPSAAQTPRALGQQGSAAQTPKAQAPVQASREGPLTPGRSADQQGSTTPRQQQQAGGASPQQQQQQPAPVQQPVASQDVKQQEVQHDEVPAQPCAQPPPQQHPQQELAAVKVQDDPLRTTAAAGAPSAQQQQSDTAVAAVQLQQSDTGSTAVAAVQLQGVQPQQQQDQLEVASGQPTKGAAERGLQKQQQQEDEGSPDLEVAAAAAAAAAAGTSAAADKAAAAAAAGAGSSAAAAGSGGVLSGLFSRKAPPPPVYVPLLPTPVNPKHKDETRMALTIAVNGCCIESMEDFVTPWEALPSGDCDRFALVWESACLKELGGALTSFLAQQALQQVAQKSIQAFLYTGLVGALALPMTLTTAMKVAFGSKWLVALRRAQAAGKMLAMQLAQGCHGGRPVTLIGCSMGARLVFHCLLELARLGLRGCVENVILLGAPLSCRPDRWCAARSVVAGRLINGYSVNDWTLGLLYRVHSSSSIWLQAAGMYKVEVPGVENINLSRLVSSHGDYLAVMEDILEAMNMHDA